MQIRLRCMQNGLLASRGHVERGDFWYVAMWLPVDVARLMCVVGLATTIPPMHSRVRLRLRLVSKGRVQGKRGVGSLESGILLRLRYRYLRNDVVVW